MEIASKLEKKERVIVYIDGFNLYFGLIEAGLANYKWLNIKQLVDGLLKNSQVVEEIKYFTSRVSNDPEKQKRQSTYIEALETVGIKIYYGQYQRNSIECRRCGNVWPIYSEKMTDVNIATHLLSDAYQDKFDMAMLISGDSDLVPPIKTKNQRFNNKRVFIAFPPKRNNSSVALVAKGSLTIGRKKIVDSQFPEMVKKMDGYILNKPANWKSLKEESI